MNKATVICVMDVSGSMGRTKKRLAKKYFHMYKGVIDGRYSEVDSVFIAHTTRASEVDSLDKLIYTSEAGGTYLSSGVNKALEVIKDRISPFERDIYVVFLSDGGNWSDDSEDTVNGIRKLCGLSARVEFIEIKLSGYNSVIVELLHCEVKTSNFKCRKISATKDIAGMLPDIFLEEVGQTPYDRAICADNLRKNNEIKKIVRTGNMTKVVLSDGSMGESRCNPEDTYDEELGFKLALHRARIKRDTKEIEKLLG